MPHSCTRALAIAALLVGAIAPAALADAPPSARPMPLELAQKRVADFLKTVPNLGDVVVVPGTGEVPWPESSQEQAVHAEVWTVVPARKTDGHPLMMFAVRPDTGEVYVMYLRSLQTSPSYR